MPAAPLISGRLHRPRAHARSGRQAGVSRDAALAPAIRANQHSVVPSQQCCLQAEAAALPTGPGWKASRFAHAALGWAGAIRGLPPVGRSGNAPEVGTLSRDLRCDHRSKCRRRRVVGFSKGWMDVCPRWPTAEGRAALADETRPLCGTLLLCGGTMFSTSIRLVGPRRPGGSTDLGIP